MFSTQNKGPHTVWRERVHGSLARAFRGDEHHGLERLAPLGEDAASRLGDHGVFGVALQFGGERFQRVPRDAVVVCQHLCLGTFSPQGVTAVQGRCRHQGVAPICDRRIAKVAGVLSEFASYQKGSIDVDQFV